VVPVEQTSHLAGNVQFVTQPEQGAHIRLPGEDFTAGTTLLLAGERLTPERLMGLATQGIHSALVRVPPVVHIFSTGNELVDPASGRSLRPGQIYNSNGPYLAALARQAGCDLRDEGILSDDPERFVAAVNRCLPESILITTGAVSMGSRDFIPQSLKTLGAEVLFHKVFIRPGKPVLFARLPGRRWFFGLPGNPVSAAVGFRFFVMPLLRQCLGQPQEQPLYARLEKDWHKPHSLRHFLKAHLRLDSQGQYHVLPDPGQMSFMVRPLLHTQGWMLVEETRHHIRAGETVSFYPYHTGGLFDA
jgi:molybdopterin molybdotransferase